MTHAKFHDSTIPGWWVILASGTSAICVGTHVSTRVSGNICRTPLIIFLSHWNDSCEVSWLYHSGLVSYTCVGNFSYEGSDTITFSGGQNDSCNHYLKSFKWLMQSFMTLPFLVGELYLRRELLLLEYVSGHVSRRLCMRSTSNLVLKLLIIKTTFM